MKGTYLLLIGHSKDSNIKVGALGEIEFKAGYYIYVGSALNGLKPRLSRHARQKKKLHWHIDYLLLHGIIIKMFYIAQDSKLECKVGNELFKNFNHILNFGSSDCKCKSHLFYSEKIEDIERYIKLETQFKEVDFKLNLNV
ncbi:MAG: GIY-YIG nuclease family protein [Methanosarcinaceae archaeon]|jgi:Uri superfamily endonuclease|nr:GIY-YIG nuclease family protein [Methanosarcinaceae archaeon]NKQ39268.1 GIY-YIG nuclease family protein [Methanosarcinales archaeon]